jgi:hypothetical protein
MIMRFEIGIEGSGYQQITADQSYIRRHRRAEAARLDASVHREPIVDQSDCAARGMSISSLDRLIPLGKASTPANTSDMSG